MEFYCQTRVWMDTLYFLGKERVQNSEFGLNKSLIKKVVYLESQKHTGHISLICTFIWVWAIAEYYLSLFLARVWSYKNCDLWLQPPLRLLSPALNSDGLDFHLLSIRCTVRVRQWKGFHQLFNQPLPWFKWNNVCLAAAWEEWQAHPTLLKTWLLEKGAKFYSIYLSDLRSGIPE